MNHAAIIQRWMRCQNLAQVFHANIHFIDNLIAVDAPQNGHGVTIFTGDTVDELYGYLRGLVEAKEVHKRINA